ncbi:RNA polymerase II transcription factor SIII subunit A [Colletotrichum orchidophilum]|uniref:RNA polymerase II transcription factor SIII subunit A n=1 Tax=Colletotrichum orchidophilum TaxID=1209926 RepID=A0A1G4ANJ6_9PEZI|nr:RNA polymerase II transcription factor SIII subunit A [Colletotrichum orchidophilum]OHE90744.1 RNA polymerase II transcription factor SIII subunit A [Colletotrichum orchidophilum]
MAPTKSLAELCIAMCQRHITELSSVGNGDALQYHHVRDILLRVINPAQLREIELNSPFIQGETSELWLRLIKKEFPSESHEKNYAPKNPSKWYKIYERYAEERREAQQQAEAELLARVQGLQQKKDNNVSRIVDPKFARFLPKPPKTGRTFSTLPRGKKELPSTLSWAAGSRMKTTTGASVMKKARREAKEIVGIRSTMAVPTGMIRAPRLNKAPPSMAAEHRISSQPVFRPTSTSSRPPTHSTYVAQTKATYVSDSSDGEEGDLFGNEGTPKKGKAAMYSSRNNRDTTISSKSANPSQSSAFKDRSSSTSARYSSGFKQSTSFSSQTSGPRRGGGILGNAPRPKSNIRFERPPSRPEPSSTNTEPSRTHKLLAQNNGPQSPPLPMSLDEVQPARPVLGNQELPRKRKAVDIFMPKKKTRR